MKVYIIKYESDKNGEEFKKVIVKASNDLSGEETFYSGFLHEVDGEKKWGKNAILEAAAEISKDKPITK